MENTMAFANSLGVPNEPDDPEDKEPDDPEVVPEEGQVEEPAIPKFGTKMWHGWRLAYRTQEPEKTPAENFAKRVRRKANAFKFGKEGIVAGNRHKTVDEIRLASDKSALKRKINKF